MCVLVSSGTHHSSNACIGAEQQTSAEVARRCTTAYCARPAKVDTLIREHWLHCVSPHLPASCAHCCCALGEGVMPLLLLYACCNVNWPPAVVVTSFPRIPAFHSRLLS